MFSYQRTTEKRFHFILHPWCVFLASSTLAEVYEPVSVQWALCFMHNLGVGDLTPLPRWGSETLHGWLPSPRFVGDRSGPGPGSCFRNTRLSLVLQGAFLTKNMWYWRREDCFHIFPKQNLVWKYFQAFLLAVLRKYFESPQNPGSPWWSICIYHSDDGVWFGAMSTYG